MSTTFTGSDWFSLNPSARAAFINSNYGDLLYPKPTVATPWRPFYNQLQSTGTVTFSFSANASSIGQDDTYNKTKPTVDTFFNDSEKALVRNELALLSTMIGINFKEVSGTSDLNFLHRNMTIGGYEVSPWDQGSQRTLTYVIMQDTVNVNSSTADNLRGWNSDGTKTFLHEMGHAFGFEHPETYRPNEPTNPPFLSQAYDTGLLTVMSYADGFIGTYGPQTYMPLDIAGLRFLYGDAKNQTAKNYYFSVDNQSLSVIGSNIYLNALAPNSLFDPSGQTTIDYSSLSNSLDSHTKCNFL